MRELKAFRIIQGDTGGYGAPSYKCDTDGHRIEEWSDACEVYDRFEADKVIEKLERDIVKFKSSLKYLVVRGILDGPVKKAAEDLLKEE